MKHLEIKMFLVPLYQQWAIFFEKKLKKEFNLDFSTNENYQVDAAPLIYCCMLHRRIAVKKWNVVLSQEFQGNEWSKQEEWVNIQKKLECGEDINPYLSKSLKNWNAVDYLLYTYKIHHFHLYKNSEGGIRNELVFGIFHKNSFYVLDIRGHNDLYSADNWIEIVQKNWPTEDILPNVVDINEINQKFDIKFFKRNANNPKLQFNNIEPLQIMTEDGVGKALKGQQHTTLINFTLNGIEYPKIPLQAYCAYINEVQHLDSIEIELMRLHGNNYTFDLHIDIKNKKYKIIIGEQFANTRFLKFNEKGVIVSLYHEQKYYPYYS